MIAKVDQFVAIVARLITLAHFVILDLGNDLLPFVQKILPLCHHLLVVTEPSPNAVIQTRALVEDLRGLGVKEETIKLVLNNRVRSETILPAVEVQNRLPFPLAATITPAPELFHLASRTRNLAYFAQPESLTARQIAKLASIFRPSAQAA